MENEVHREKSWWKLNWKWFVPVVGIFIIAIALFFSSQVSGVASDMAQAYADTGLYEDALKKAKAKKAVSQLLGEIEPIDKLAILEGHVEYLNEYKTVNSSVRVKGTKGKAQLDISANRVNDQWNYTKINIRIKNPPEKKQIIEIIPSE